MAMYVSPGDQSQKLKIFVEQPVTNDPEDLTLRIVETGELNVYSDTLVEGSTVPSQFHIEWTPLSSDLAATTLSGSVVI